MPETEWPHTIWSEARQVNGLNGWAEMTGDHLPPAAFFRALRNAERDEEAAMFLAQALPRYEAVIWAMRTIEGIAEAHPPALQRIAAAIRTWIADPSEANRRMVGDLAVPIDPPAPVTLCGLASFYTGGSIAPIDQPVAPPPRGLAGRFAGVAVIAAVSLDPEPAHRLQRALDDGQRIACGDMENAS